MNAKTNAIELKKQELEQAKKEFEKLKFRHELKVQIDKDNGSDHGSAHRESMERSLEQVYLANDKVFDLENQLCELES